MLGFKLRNQAVKMLTICGLFMPYHLTFFKINKNVNPDIY